jgi:hypothetical protein
MMDVPYPEVETPDLPHPEVEVADLPYPEVEQTQEATVAPPSARLKKVTPGNDAVDAGVSHLNDLLATPKIDEALAENPAATKTIGGFAGNVVKSGGRFLRDIGKGVLQAPLAGIKAASDLYREASSSDKRWKQEYSPTDTVKKMFTGAATQVGDSLIDRYAKEYVKGTQKWETDPETGQEVFAGGKKTDPSWLKAVGDVGYADPIGTLTDLAVVKDIPAAGMKIAGRELGSKGLVKAGEALGTVGGRTVQAAEDLAQKGVFKLGKKTGLSFIEAMGVEDPAARRAALALKGEEFSKVPLQMEADEKALVPAFQRMPREARAAIAEVALLGEAASPEALTAVMNGPGMAEALAEYGKYLKNDREAWMLSERVATPKVLRRRVEAQVALTKYRDLSDESLALAREDIRGMTIKPVYVPTRRFKGDFSLDDILDMPSEARVGNAPFLEPFKGKSPFSTDPIQFIPQAIKEFRAAEGNVRWVKRLQEHPDFFKAATAEEAKGMKVIPTQGIAQRYFEDSGGSRAKSLFTRQLVNKGADAGYEMIRNDPKIAERLAQITKVIPTNTAAGRQVHRMLKMEFSKWTGTAGEALRLWDNLNTIFKTAAIRYNPHYYAGNAVGDAILSLVAGVMPWDMRRAEKLKEYMPSQALRATGTAADLVGGKMAELFPKVNEAYRTAKRVVPGLEAADATARKGYSWLNDVDAAGKRALITKELVKGLKATGIPAQGLMEELKRILPSIDKLSEAEVARGAAHETLAKSATKMYEAKPKGKARAQAAFESSVKGAKEIESTVPQLQKDAALLRPAVAKAEQFFASYNNLGPVEQYVFRRIFPFYAFNKAMFTLSSKIAVIAPKSAALWSRFADYMGKQIDEDSRPTMYQNYVPLPGGEHGSLQGLSPFEGTAASETAGVPHPGFIDPMQSPLFAAAFGAKGGKTKYSTPYSGQDIPTKGGKSYEPQPDGSMKEVVEQPSVAKVIGRFAPVLPQIEKTIYPNGAGVFANETGQKNPKSRLEGLAQSLGLKLVSKTMEEMTQQKALEILGPVTAMKAEIRRLTILSNTETATPETRTKAAKDARVKRVQLDQFLKVRKIEED